MVFKLYKISNYAPNAVPFSKPEGKQKNQSKISAAALAGMPIADAREEVDS